MELHSDHHFPAAEWLSVNVSVATRNHPSLLESKYVFLTIAVNNSRSETPVTEATDTDVTGVTEDVVPVTTTDLPQEDVILTLPDSSDKIKLQNIEKAVFSF